MVAGGLFIHGAVRALWSETGYDADHTLDLSVRYPESSTYTPEHKSELARQLRDRMAAMPGVVAATTARAPDDLGLRAATVSIDGAAPAPNHAEARLCYTWIQPDYFQTLGIPLSVGHGFASRETEAVILSRSAADRLWPGENPLGRTLRLSTASEPHTADEPLPDGPSRVVIGVARDTRGVLFDGNDSEQIYLPMADRDLWRHPILIRTRTATAELANALGPVIAGVDPDLMVRAATLEEMLKVTPTFVLSTAAATLASSVGLLGLFLVSIGIYGTVSCMVVLRTKEIGIRMALGAGKREILRLLLKDSTRPVFAGLLIGLLLAGGVSYLLRHVLYGIRVLDGFAFGTVSLLLLLIAVLAAFVPSRRAMRVEPVVALRHE